MNQVPHFLLMDKSKNVLLIPTNDAAEMIRRVGFSEVMQHSTRKQLDDTIRRYLAGEWDGGDENDNG